jgi:hypothetical protein
MRITTVLTALTVGAAVTGFATTAAVAAKPVQLGPSPVTGLGLASAPTPDPARPGSCLVQFSWSTTDNGSYVYHVVTSTKPIHKNPKGSEIDTDPVSQPLSVPSGGTAYISVQAQYPDLVLTQPVTGDSGVVTC